MESWRGQTEFQVNLKLGLKPCPPAMELARHHDADLTFGRYAHTRLEDLSKVVDRLPDLRVPQTLRTSAVSERPNGTTPNHRESSAERSQVDP